MRWKRKAVDISARPSSDLGHESDSCRPSLLEILAYLGTIYCLQHGQIRHSICRLPRVSACLNSLFMETNWLADAHVWFKCFSSGFKHKVWRPLLPCAEDFLFNLIKSDLLLGHIVSKFLLAKADPARWEPSLCCRVGIKVSVARLWVKFLVHILISEHSSSPRRVFTLLDCRCPIKCHWMSVGSWGAFSTISYKCWCGGKT